MHPRPDISVLTWLERSSTLLQLFTPYPFELWSIRVFLFFFFFFSLRTLGGCKLSYTIPHPYTVRKTVNTHLTLLQITLPLSAFHCPYTLRSPPPFIILKQCHGKFTQIITLRTKCALTLGNLRFLPIWGAPLGSVCLIMDGIHLHLALMLDSNSLYTIVN